MSPLACTQGICGPAYCIPDTNKLAQPWTNFFESIVDEGAYQVPGTPPSSRVRMKQRPSAMNKRHRSLAVASLGAAGVLAGSAGLLGAAWALDGIESPVTTSPFVDGAGEARRRRTALGARYAAGEQRSGSESLKPFIAPDDPGAGAVYVTISGESNAVVGYPFPPNDFTTDTYMVDGWAFTIDEYIVSLDKVTLWSNPNQDPTNQSKHGGAVAHLDGPFVVDLHKGGHIIGQGGAPEEATPIGVVANQNDNGNAGFDPTTTYGFGFSTVPASYTAADPSEPGPFNVNLDPSEAADFDLMVQKGYSVLYVGRATWKGSDSPYGCTQTNAGSQGAVDGGYDFSQTPQSLTFKLGFSTPTNYVNCQNMSLQGTPNSNEDYPRGLQVSTSQSAIAQVTVHMDHPFWESFLEDTPVHFDQIAAQYVGATGIPEAHVEDMVGVPFYAFTDKTGTPLPWRNCSGTYYTPPGNGQMAFSTAGIRVDPKGVCVGIVGQDFLDGRLPGHPRLLRFPALHAVDAGAPELAGALLHRPAVPRARWRLVTLRAPARRWAAPTT